MENKRAETKINVKSSMGMINCLCLYPIISENSCGQAKVEFGGGRRVLMSLVLFFN